MNESACIQNRLGGMNKAELIRERDRVRNAIKQTTAPRELSRYYRRESLICREIDKRDAAFMAQHTATGYILL